MCFSTLIELRRFYYYRYYAGEAFALRGSDHVGESCVVKDDHKIAGEACVTSISETFDTTEGQCLQAQEKAQKPSGWACTLTNLLSYPYCRRASE